MQSYTCRNRKKKDGTINRYKFGMAEGGKNRKGKLCKLTIAGKNEKRIKFTIVSGQIKKKEIIFNFTIKVSWRGVVLSVNY